MLRITGAKDESRMSFNHRIKVEGVKGHVVTEMQKVYVNVWTLRETRHHGLRRGGFKNNSTKNNWIIPSIVRMIRTHGIYIAALSETRRATKETDVGDGYVLLTSQNKTTVSRGSGTYVVAGGCRGVACGKQTEMVP